MTVEYGQPMSAGRWPLRPFPNVLCKRQNNDTRLVPNEMDSPRRPLRPRRLDIRDDFITQPPPAKPLLLGIQH